MMSAIWRTGLASFKLSRELIRLQLCCLHTSSFLLDKFVMKNIEHSPAKQMVNITWQDGSSHRYPYIYLRDNCQCSECFFKDSSQRLLDIVKDIDINIKPDKVEMSDNGAKLSITWPDNHVSLLDADWLFEKRLLEETECVATECSEVTTRNVTLWGSEFKDRVPRLKFDDILNDKEVEFEWLNSLYRYGITLVTDIPVQEGQLVRLGDLVGYLRMTAYG